MNFEDDHETNESVHRNSYTKRSHENGNEIVNKSNKIRTKSIR